MSDSDSDGEIDVFEDAANLIDEFARGGLENITSADYRYYYSKKDIANAKILIIDDDNKRHINGLNKHMQNLLYIRLVSSHIIDISGAKKARFIFVDEDNGIRKFPTVTNAYWFMIDGGSFARVMPMVYTNIISIKIQSRYVIQLSKYTNSQQTYIEECLGLLKLPCSLYDVTEIGLRCNANIKIPYLELQIYGKYSTETILAGSQTPIFQDKLIIMYQKYKIN